jgi:hypothetical protein
MKTLATMIVTADYVDALNDPITMAARLRLYSALVEAFENSRRHAYPKTASINPAVSHWWMSGAACQAEKRLTLVVYDQGVTIPASLPGWLGYDSQVAFGQSRVLPNGRSIVLERQPGADTAGYAGLEDEADNHWNALFKAALLSTLLGVGSELGSTSGHRQQRRYHSGASPRIQRQLEPDRTENCSAQSQYPADIDDPAGIPGARDRQS